jgi:hypothetical protein
MPKIKLSALASDIKGKSQGSVFSTNSGGTYFRNNPSGGGRKTAQSAAQKNRFGSLATRWKALTNEQRTQWRESASAYPTINAFGDSRIPSGYELFMRLNGVLVSNDLPLLTVPGTSREIPLIEGIDIISPDLWMFTPNTQFKTNLSRSETVFGLSPGFFNGVDFRETQTFGVRITPPRTLSFASKDSLFSPIFYSEDVDHQGFCLQLIAQSNTFSYLKFVVNTKKLDNADTAMIVKADLPTDFFRQSSHVCVRFTTFEIEGLDDDEPTNSMVAQIFVNGTLLEAPAPSWYNAHQNLLSATTSGSEISAPDIRPDTSYSAPFALGGYYDVNDIPCDFSDFAYLRNSRNELTCCDEGGGECAPDFVCQQVSEFGCECWYVQETAGGNQIPSGPYDIILLSKGYYLGSEQARIGLNKVVSFASPFEMGKQSSGFINEANGNSSYNLSIVIEPECETNEDCNPTCGDAECQDGVCVYVGDGVPFVVGTNETFVPWAYVTKNEYEEEGFFIQLLCSGAISAGKSEFQTKYKKLFTFPLNSDSLDVSSFIKSMFGGLSGGTTYAYKARIIDGTTGVAYDTDIPVKKPRNPRRFKAGAELSAKVT